MWNRSNRENIPLIIRQGKKVNFKNIFLVVTEKSEKDMKTDLQKDIADTVKSSKATESMPSHVHFWSQTSASALVGYFYLVIGYFGNNQSKKNKKTSD